MNGLRAMAGVVGCETRTSFADRLFIAAQAEDALTSNLDDLMESSHFFFASWKDV
jgi:hypothetical protein